VLAPGVPLAFQAWSSNPRPPGAPPYDRLVLISSRVHEPMRVAQAALSDVAVVVYDWKRFTLQVSHLTRQLCNAINICSMSGCPRPPPSSPAGAADACKARDRSQW
jgi:hypothetical protein